jgi:plasmid stabilization system protein ParE
MAKVIFSTRASGDVDAARMWWVEHRGTPALGNALAAALDRIGRFPEIGALVKKRGKWSKTRRYILDGVGYHLYYDYSASTGVIVVTRFWHESRRPPRL